MIFSNTLNSYFHKILFQYSKDYLMTTSTLGLRYGGTIGQFLLEYSNTSGEVIRAVLTIHTHGSQKLKDPIHNHSSPKFLKTTQLNYP
jgi:hypothetical protein